VEIFPGFAAAELLYDEHGALMGIATGDMGIDRHGNPTDGFEPGVELHARYTLLAEGARGHLGKQVISRFRLDEGKDPQTYAIGIKELWEVDPAVHQPGLAIHTAGWPLQSDTYGGSFLYHLDNNQVAVGYVVGLAYQMGISAHRDRPFRRIVTGDFGRS
jgi:electron-transferring-flavoprotein dehydrogenase